MHFALEEAYGYFEDAVSVAPKLCEEAEELAAAQFEPTAEAAESAAPEAEEAEKDQSAS